MKPSTPLLALGSHTPASGPDAGDSAGPADAAAYGCATWKGLGALGAAINVSDHLHVGTPTGLETCALSEVAATDTCARISHGPAASAADPIDITTTDVWYRGDRRVRRVARRPRVDSAP